MWRGWCTSLRGAAVKAGCLRHNSSCGWYRAGKTLLFKSWQQGNSCGTERPSRVTPSRQRNQGALRLMAGNRSTLMQVRKKMLRKQPWSGNPSYPVAYSWSGWYRMRKSKESRQKGTARIRLKRNIGLWIHRENLEGKPEKLHQQEWGDQSWTADTL